MSDIVPDLDLQTVRDKFTGRSNLFFNTTNAGGTRFARQGLNDILPALELDPSVKYRTIGGQAAFEDFQRTGLVRGTYPSLSHVPDTVFFNQSLPLWSYVNRGNDPDHRYLIATLGEDWTDRDASNIKSGAGTKIIDEEKKPLRNGNQYGKNYIFDLEHKKLIAELQDWAFRNIDARTSSVLPYSSEEATKLWDIHRKLAQKSRGLWDAKEWWHTMYDQNNPPRSLMSGKEHPSAKYLANLTSGLTGWAKTDFGGMSLDDIRTKNMERLKSDYFAIGQRSFSPVDGTFRGIESSTNLIEAMLQNAWELYSLQKEGGDNPFQLDLIKTLNAIDDVYRQSGKFFEGAKDLSNMPLSAEAYAKLQADKQGGLVNPQYPELPFGIVPSPNTALNTVPDYLPFGSFGPLVNTNERNGNFDPTRLLDKYGNPVTANTPLESFYDRTDPRISPSLIRLGAIDDNSPTWSSGISIENLLKSAGSIPVTSHHVPKLLQDLNVTDIGIEGAMHSEVLPVAKVTPSIEYTQNWRNAHGLSNFASPSGWSFPAYSVGNQSRPMAVFRLNPNAPNGIELVQEFNNDALPSGVKPIPVGPPRENVAPDAINRYIEEAVRALDEGRVSGYSYNRNITGYTEGSMPSSWENWHEGAKLGGDPIYETERQGTPSIYDILREDSPASGRAYLLPDGSIDTEAFIRDSVKYRGLYPNLREALGAPMPDYHPVANILEESNKRSRAFGRKGFVAVPKFLDKIAGEMALDMQSSPASNFTEALKRYKTDPQARNFVKSYTGQAASNAVKGLGLAAYAHGLATDAPSTIVAAGLPFTKFMGVGPVLPLNAGEDEYLYNRDHGLLPETKPREVNNAYLDYIYGFPSGM